MSLADAVTWLVGQHLRALEGDTAAAELKSTALTILGDGLLLDDCHVVDVDSEGLWVERQGVRYPLREMSDGLRTITALVVDLLRQVYESYALAREGGLSLVSEGGDGRTVVPVPGVVLIDEVDAHLHVSWQRRIGPWLTAHFPGIQFLVTTHSPYICQSADPGGLIRLPGPGERTGPQVVDDDLYERVVYGSGDDAALSALFGLDSPYSEKAEGSGPSWSRWRRRSCGARPTRRPRPATPASNSCSPARRRPGWTRCRPACPCWLLKNPRHRNRDATSDQAGTDPAAPQDCGVPENVWGPGRGRGRPQDDGGGVVAP